MVARPYMFYSTAALVGLLLFAPSIASAQGSPTPATRWTEDDHTGSAPKSFKILTTSTVLINSDILSQTFSRGALGTTQMPVVGAPVTLTITGGGLTGVFPAVTNAGGKAFWSVPGLPLGINTFTCTVALGGGVVRNGVVLNPAAATFTVTRTNR